VGKVPANSKCPALAKIHTSTKDSLQAANIVNLFFNVLVHSNPNINRAGHKTNSGALDMESGSWKATGVDGWKDGWKETWAVLRVVFNKMVFDKKNLSLKTALPMAWRSNMSSTVPHERMPPD
jgi:hypothetical protein